MAPKGRKKGEKRIDAALDAMHLYGFPRKLVRTTVDSLLKVYGRQDGWVFIEDSSYTLLIDTLLENQANPSPQDGLIEANPGDGPNEVTPAGCSNSALLACCKAQTSDDTPLADQVMGTVSVASETGSQLPIKSVDTVSTTSGIGSAFSKSVGISSVNRGSANGLLVKAESETPIKAVTISAEINSENLAWRENQGPKSPQLVPRLDHKRRRPCYGWISSDEEDEENIIELIPSPRM
ncbi:hypothetical protein PHAVU_007G184700 [Phaseolus vulgaris]|uniref:WIYLD domain-containing protein n=1 Tax=Phaseolus vulgaris TaxID=3885 RepID=V7BJM9_PHAVU|nr:hypothetical protein PHAVU_007G184700g [Phaseolus vulgaris]ESW16786.1 hypothetical protein PHAVU_007G184700g [Phaseolus vulgaris]